MDPTTTTRAGMSHATPLDHRLLAGHGSTVEVKVAHRAFLFFEPEPIDPAFSSPDPSRVKLQGIVPRLSYMVLPVDIPANCDLRGAPSALVDVALLCDDTGPSRYLVLRLVSPIG